MSRHFAAHSLPNPPFDDGLLSFYGILAEAVFVKDLTGRVVDDLMTEAGVGEPMFAPMSCKS